MLAREGFAGLVAERDREVVGSAFVDERSAIAGIGPVTVAPDVQDDGVGRALMEAALRRERERGAAGIRLVQTAYHYRSLALYSKLGFVVREPLSVLQGAPPALSFPGRAVRPARPSSRRLQPRSPAWPSSTASLRWRASESTLFPLQPNGRSCAESRQFNRLYGW